MTIKDPTPPEDHRGIDPPLILAGQRLFSIETLRALVQDENVSHYLGAGVTPEGSFSQADSREQVHAASKPLSKARVLFVKGKTTGDEGNQPAGHHH